jgi:hypothetical protein
MFARTWTPPPKLRDIEREPQKLSRPANYGSAVLKAAPKRPADRNQDVRDLAMGEQCQIRLSCCRNEPLFTVLCHTNTQTDQKGMGYKGHDSAGFFGCDACHSAIDGRKLTPNEVDARIEAAQERTRARVREIAASITERPWRVRAARWWIAQLEKVS